MTFSEFKTRARATVRVDLDSYKENQLRRRIDSFMHKHGITGYGQFLEVLKSDRPVYEAFLNHLTINVSEFFRDPQKFAELEREHLPPLLKSGRSLKIWSAACSIGAEPYSMAILLKEKNKRCRFQILATDVDRNILTVAAKGVFNADAVKNVSKERLARYFVPEGDGYQVTADLKKSVTFKHHDLLQNRFENGFDLILCRNVTIYFTREAQERVNAGFAKALNPGGILFIGGSEMIFNYQQLGLEKTGHSFYRKATKSGH